jgi:hypothetical protein
LDNNENANWSDTSSSCSPSESDSDEEDERVPAASLRKQSRVGVPLGRGNFGYEYGSSNLKKVLKPNEELDFDYPVEELDLMGDDVEERSSQKQQASKTSWFAGGITTLSPKRSSGMPMSRSVMNSNPGVGELASGKSAKGLVQSRQSGVSRKNRRSSFLSDDDLPANNEICASRMLLAFFAIMLLWLFCFSVSKGVASLTVPSPEHTLMFDRCEDTWAHASEQQEAYLDCVTVNVKRCHSTLDKVYQAKSNYFEGVGIQNEQRLTTLKVCCFLGYRFFSRI